MSKSTGRIDAGSATLYYHIPHVQTLPIMPTLQDTDGKVKAQTSRNREGKIGSAGRYRVAKTFRMP